MQLDPTQYRSTFFDEAAEQLTVLEAALLRLDAYSSDNAAVNEAFRAAHTMKSGAQAVGFEAVGRFTHQFEELLDRFRHGGPVPRRMLDLLLEASDTLGQMIASDRNGDPPPPGTDDILARLVVGNDDSAAGSLPPAALASVVTVTPHADAFRTGLDPLALIRELRGLGSVEQVRLNSSKLPPLADLNPESCYLSWTVQMRGAQPEAVAELFAFARDMIEVTVQPVAADAAEAKAGKQDAPPSSGVRTPDAAKAKTGKQDALAASHLARVESLARRLPTPDPLRLAAFLVGKGAITAEQVLDALLEQRTRRPMIGALAVQTGRMTVEHLFQTLDRMMRGEPFGQAALSLHHLSENDLGRLFVLQEQSTPPLRDILVEKRLLTPEQAASEMHAFRAAGAAGADSYSELPEPDLPPPPGASLLDENGSMIGEFCTEADEHLEAADRNLLTLDATPTNAEALNAVYRAFHTVKGVASMLGLTALQLLAHEAENLLNLARDGKIVLRGKPLDLAFASNDALKRQIRAIRKWSAARGRLEEDSTLPTLLADLRAATSEKAPPAPPTAASPPTPAIPPQSALETEPHPESGPAPRGAGAEKETVRVDKGRLDKLINTIGELVIAQSMAQEEFDTLTRRTGGHSLALTELSKISRDLQELSLSLRMIALQGTFQKMTRLVRDLSRKLGKTVDLKLHGEETELDKTVVDQLGDPLMHMIRNALDHGLETPAERIAAGKPAEGRLILRAYHQGGSVYLVLTDDGRGLDRDRILRKAIEKGIVAEGQRLPDQEIYALIFAPGFSTAAVVTDVSGRGVGLDVVRRNVEALQGAIHIRTQQGKGTTFTIRLPLTLAIMDGLMVGLGGDVYVLPLLSVVESFRPSPGELYTIAGQGEVVTVRGEVVPLLRLYRLLGRPGQVTDPCAGLVVLVEDQGKKHALLVDELLGQMQAVVKSLDANYRRVEGLAGATILGDGSVAMILDIHGLIRLHGQCSVGRSAAGGDVALAASLDELPGGDTL